MSFIVAHNVGGLGNIMKNIVSCFRLSNNVKVYWENIESFDSKNYHLFSCDYDSLFSYPELLENSMIKDNLKCYNDSKLPISDTDNIPNNFSKFNSKCSKKYRLPDKYNRNIDFEYNRIPKNVQNIYIDLFKKIKLNKEVESKIDRFYNENMKDKNIIGVHIRSWNRDNEAYRSHLYDIAKFIYYMEQYKENNYFFVSSDSQEPIKILKSKFNNIITYNRESDLHSSRLNTNGLKDDLIELYLLAKGKMLIGSHFSTFSEVAWYLAGCPKTIIVS